MKSVLISIKPKYCELIAAGKKTIEVRKTKPRIETPFKCYIYQPKTVYVSKNKSNEFLKPIQDKRFGKIIGEFICNEIQEIQADNLVALYFNNPFNETCVTDLEMRKYANGKNLFLWHISNLAIYDEPKELSKFYTWCPEYEREYITSKCTKCRYYLINEFDGCFECACEGEKLLTRPPQSWCYVVEGR